MKRPALRGDVTRAGVTCDARLLSCYNFEPLHRPLLRHFAGCKYLRIQLYRGTRDHLKAGWSVRLSGASVFLSRILGVKSFLAITAHRGPCTAFQLLGGHGCHPARRSATNRLTTRNRGPHGFGLRSKPRLIVISRENQRLPFRSFATILERCSIGRALLPDYSMVNFSALGRGLFFVSVAQILSWSRLYYVAGYGKLSISISPEQLTWRVALFDSVFLRGTQLLFSNRLTDAGNIKGNWE